MNSINWAELFINVAIFAITLMMIAPQAVRLICTKEVGGVSLSSICIRFACSTGWIAYATSTFSIGILLGELLFAAMLVITIILLIRNGASARYGILAGITAIALFGSISAISFTTHTNLSFLGQALGISVLLYGAPALWQGLRSADLNGLSLVALCATSVDAVLWGFLGHIQNDDVFLIYAAVQTVVTLPVLVRKTHHYLLQWKQTERIAFP